MWALWPSRRHYEFEFPTLTWLSLTDDYGALASVFKTGPQRGSSLNKHDWGPHQSISLTAWQPGLSSCTVFHQDPVTAFTVFKVRPLAGTIQWLIFLEACEEL